MGSRHFAGTADAGPTDARTAAAFTRPTGFWTRDRPLGRALSAVVGAAALLSGVMLGGLFTWTFWAGLIAPDIPFLYDARDAGSAGDQPSPRVARLYELLNHPGLPLAAIAVGVAAVNRPLVVGGLGWIAHLAIDRALGHGPRRLESRLHRPHRPSPHPGAGAP